MKTQMETDGHFLWGGGFQTPPSRTRTQRLLQICCSARGKMAVHPSDGRSHLAPAPPPPGANTHPSPSYNKSVTARRERPRSRRYWRVEASGAASGAIYVNINLCGGCGLAGTGLASIHFLFVRRTTCASDPDAYAKAPSALSYGLN